MVVDTDVFEFSSLWLCAVVCASVCCSELMCGNIGKGVMGSSKKSLLFTLIRDHSPFKCAKYVLDSGHSRAIGPHSCIFCATVPGVIILLISDPVKAASAKECRWRKLGAQST